MKKTQNRVSSLIDGIKAIPSNHTIVNVDNFLAKKLLYINKSITFIID